MTSMATIIPPPASSRRLMDNDAAAAISAESTYSVHTRQEAGGDGGGPFDAMRVASEECQPNAVAVATTPPH